MDIIRRLFIAIVMVVIGIPALYIAHLLGFDSSFGKFFSVIAAIGIFGGIIFGIKSIKDYFG